MAPVCPNLTPAGPQAPSSPHWRRDVPFEDVVQFIRDHGYREVFEPTGKEMTYLDIGGWKYWTMGAPLPETILINRERIAGELVTTGRDGKRVDSPSCSD